MCNRYRQLMEKGRLGSTFNALVHDHERLPHTELYPRRPAALIRKADGERMVDVMSWGIPRRLRGKSGKMITNVRSRYSLRTTSAGSTGRRMRHARWQRRSRRS